MNKTPNKYSILVVDDEPLIRNSLYEILRIEGYTVYTAQNAEEALTLIKDNAVDIVITDMKLPTMSGIDLLGKIRKSNSEIDTIMITGFGTIETAVEAMKKGAYDYITKPVNDSEIKLIISKIVERKKILQENKDLRQFIASTTRSAYHNLIGASKALQKIYHLIDSVAGTNATILIAGESGTGKSMVATAIHECDKTRKGKPFVEISCGALSETLLESELFGHVKGSFTGAIKDKEGRFELAHDGTIFLDEIDTFSPNLQVKLLRVLQYGDFERVGDNKTRKTNARIIVATNQDLMNSVKDGQFREDLYYRINVINIKMPSLRERKEDIESLTEHFVARYAKKNNKKIEGVSDEVQKLFLDYNWPGNIRELENAIEGAIIMTKTGTINKWDIPNVTRFSSTVATKTTNGKSLKKVLEEPERDLIISVLDECNWNRNKAAASLGVNRTTLYNKMKKYKIPFKKT